MAQERVTNTGQRVISRPAAPKRDVIFDQDAQPGLGGLARVLAQQQAQPELETPEIPDAGLVDPEMLPEQGRVGSASLQALLRLLGGQ